MLSHSPDRNTFQKENYLKRCAEEGKEPNKAYLRMFEESNINKMAQEQDSAWQQNNMEYDLRTSDFMLAKVRDKESYAQNLYAAMCNNDFQRLDIMPILSDKKWSCSWRYAGGIVAHMREEGDYIDWYCTGIRGVNSPGNGSVGESIVTDEIREDLHRLGWIVLDNSDTER